jgi:hypothetical protein
MEAKGASAVVPFGSKSWVAVFEDMSVQLYSGEGKYVAQACELGVEG